jgi:BlaI family penicillinase repressor
MQNKPKISDAEWQIMQILWRKSPQTANQIIDSISETTPWKPKTVRTLINRLTTKNAVTFEKQGRQYLYTPTLSENQCLGQETESFIKRAGTKALKPMLAAFIEGEKLSPQEIAELKQILENK